MTFAYLLISTVITTPLSIGMISDEEAGTSFAWAAPLALVLRRLGVANVYYTVFDAEYASAVLQCERHWLKSSTNNYNLHLLAATPRLQDDSVFHYVVHPAQKPERGRILRRACHCMRTLAVSRELLRSFANTRFPELRRRRAYFF